MRVLVGEWRYESVGGWVFMCICACICAPGAVPNFAEN